MRTEIHAGSPSSSLTAQTGNNDLRHKRVAPFYLVELDPQLVVDGKVTEAGFLSDEEVESAGKMRELCPYCTDVPLQLALRSKHVIRTHLFCDKCTRCYDVVFHDGSLAFVFPGVPIE